MPGLEWTELKTRLVGRHHNRDSQPHSCNHAALNCPAQVDIIARAWAIYRLFLRLVCGTGLLLGCLQSFDLISGCDRGCTFFIFNSSAQGFIWHHTLHWLHCVPTIWQNNTNRISYLDSAISVIHRLSQYTLPSNITVNFSTLSQIDLREWTWIM